ncbi:MAG: metallopeptidase family protein [Myxococcota bacterium]|nr:metallopeptidase family protein [Myxococcota bacterium]
MSRPVTLDPLLEEAEAALTEGDLVAAEAYCRQAIAERRMLPEAHYLLGETLRDLGRLDEAEGAYRSVVLGEESPVVSDAWAALSTVLLQQLRWEESRKAANRALRDAPDNPEAAWVRGVLRERRGDVQGAMRDFSRAWRVDPVVFPMPQPLSDELIDEVVSECLEALHPILRNYLANVPILVEDFPSEDLLSQYDPPAGPTQILGYFAGTSLADRSLENPWSNLPATIVLFRTNLQRRAQDREGMLEELRITLFHEVGHFLGLSEEDLEDRGLD